MKALKYFSIAALALLAIVSCNQKEVIEVGKPDLEGCHGVYFPANSANGLMTVDPSAAKTLNITIARKESKGSLTVPVVVTETSKDEKIFVVPEVKFEDGQAEATFAVTFDKAKIGVKYGLTLSVEDPQYVSTYTNNSTSVHFDVMVIEWKDLGKGLIRDDLISSVFGVPGKCAEIEWNIYERGDKPGFYKLVGPYGTKMLAALWGNKYPETEFEENVTTKDATLYIDATNPDKVVFLYQNLGCKISSDGELWAGSRLPNGKDFSFGTLKGGVITFPNKGIILGTKDEPSWYANTNGMFRVVLPGTVLVDYGFSIGVGENAPDGNLPVSFNKGTDVKNVIYAAFEGKLDAEGVKSAVKKIAKGSVSSQKTSENTIALKFDKTGIYTLVAIALNDKDELVNTAAADFGYIAAGDDKPVVLDYGLLVSNKYKFKGHTAENSIEFYIFGEDIKEIRLTLVEAVIYDKTIDYSIEALMKLKPQSAEFLKNVNGDGASNVFINLSPGTEYVMLIAANNGYKTQIFSTRATTAGKAKMAYRNFYLGELTNEFIPSSANEYNGTHNLYAKEVSFKKTEPEFAPKRTFHGQVKVVNHPASSSEAKDTVVVSGMFAKLAKEMEVEDKFDVRFIYNNGFLLYLATPGPKVKIGKNDYYTIVEPLDDKANSYGPVSGVIVGTKPDKGIVALYPEPGVQSNYGITFKSLAVSAYKNPGFKKEDFAGVLIFALEDIIWVDPEIDDSDLAPKPGKTSFALWSGGRKHSLASSLREQRIPSAKFNLSQAEFVEIGEISSREVKAVEFTESKLSFKSSRELEPIKAFSKF